MTEPKSFMESYQGYVSSGQALGQQINKVASFLSSLSVILINLTTRTVEVFFRHNFGERYLNTLTVLLGLAAVNLFMMPWVLVLVYSGDQDLGTIGMVFFAGSVLFQAAFVTASIIHIIINRARASSGKRWHSMSDGESWLTSMIKAKEARTADRWVRQIVEPLVCMAAGPLLVLIFPPLAIYLFLTGVLLAFKAAITHARGRAEFLDLVDKQIESQHWAEMLEGKPPRETEGFVVRGMHARNAGERRTLEDIFSGLDPDTASIINSSQQGPQRELKPALVGEMDGDRRALPPSG